MIRVCQTGRNPTMRHLLRTHGVAVAWLHEQFTQGRYRLIYTPSAFQAADVYTKSFDNSDKWVSVCQLINLLPSPFSLPEQLSFWTSADVATYEPPPLPTAAPVVSAASSAFRAMSPARGGVSGA